ncbi:MAG: deoxyribose-phosphate aldolase [Kiritimatiellales bacterium]|nr:deoxyribose-phosphate aldolase [Pontiella sp.]NNJ70142.1 deoxyribose-phosphate aldolase [Kiritimatiellales bacterium]
MNEYTIPQVAATIDHAVLKPNQTEDDVRTHAELCIQYGVASMCVRPCDIRLAAGLLQDSGILVSSVLSFPHGHDSSATKVFQAREAIESGTEEIDMVMNIGAFLSGNHAYVLDDIAGVVALAHAHGVRVKVIQESCFLTLEQVGKACEIAWEAEADFVKTSTGFGPSSATPEIIEKMVQTVGGKMGIKASGGIRTWEHAVGYLRQGATRLGIGDTKAVLEGKSSTGDY